MRDWIKRLVHNYPNSLLYKIFIIIAEIKAIRTMEIKKKSPKIKIMPSATKFTRWNTGAQRG